MQLFSPQAPTRKDLYRGFLRRFNPAANPEDSLNADLIEKAIASDRIRRLMAPLLLRPGSQRLLIGGIGSGKSTHLKLLQKAIQESEPSTIALLLDVSSFADLGQSQPGAVMLAVALALSGQGALSADEQGELRSTFVRIREIAFGYLEPSKQPYLRDLGQIVSVAESLPASLLARYSQVRIPGRIVVPNRAIDPVVREIAELFGKIKLTLGTLNRELILLMDGIDRLLDQQVFWQYVHHDFAEIRKLEISVVSTAPLSLLYANGRTVLDHFDSFESVPAIETDDAGLRQLLNVLQRRNAHELISLDLQRDLAKASGGILRDLISLVQDAAQNAYFQDSDSVTKPNVADAIRQLGNSYLLGLGATQQSQLLEVLNGKSFSQTSKDDLDLLISRRLIERTTRYEVHPALLKAMRP